MPAADSTPPSASVPHPEPRRALPSITTSKSPSEVLAALSTAARRGKLAGFEPRSTFAFVAAAFGSPFDGLLHGSAAAAPSGSGSTIRFEARLKPLIPVIAAVVFVATIWPGVSLTESLIASFFPGSSAWRYTWWWYMPLSVPFIPWAFWSALRRSRASVHESALEVIGKVAKEVGRVKISPLPPPAPPPAESSVPPATARNPESTPRPAANSPGAA